MFHTSIKTKIVLGFGLTIIIILIVGSISYQNIHNLMRSLDYLSQPDTKLIKLNSLLSDLSLAESNIRSYFISSDKKNLEEYEAYSRKLEINIDSLSAITNHSPNEREKINKIRSLWHEKKSHTIELISLYRNRMDKKLPDNIFSKINQENVDVPTVVVTKTITISQKEIPLPPDTIKNIEKSESQPEEKKSFFSRLLKKKEKSNPENDTIETITVIQEETTTKVDTIFKVGRSNEVKEKAFFRILSSIRKQNMESRQMLQNNETEIIQKDIDLIEYIRNIVVELKNSEEKITQANILEAKKNVEVSVIKIFIFGFTGITAILILGFFIMNDVTKNNYHKNQLLNEKLQAEELVKAKETFLATMSHEIRTPLNSIIGFTEQLSQTNLLNKQKYFLQAVVNSTAHLLTLVNDILDHSRIEAGKIEFESTEFSLSEIMQEVYEAFHLKAEEKGLTLNYFIEEDKQLLIGDPLRLKQILFNLVSNALKFTESGTVTLFCQQITSSLDKAEVVISVKDTGIGIPADKVDTIFDTFTQADSSISRKFGGTGLGLTISRKLVELQGGKITLNSSLNVGSEFIISIPYSVSEKKYLSQSHVPDSPLTVPGPLRILVVEDDEFNLLLFHAILTKWNMKVRMVSNGKEALDLLTLEEYDLIITDIHMPGMSGYELLKEIKNHANEKISQVPILAVTANISKNTKELSGNLQFDDILLKPFKEEHLANVIIKISGNSNNVLLKKYPFSLKKGEFNNSLFSDFIKFSGGNIEALNSMVETFIKDTQTIIENLNKDYKNKDWEQLKDSVHKLIPRFGHIQNHSMIQLLRETEKCLNQDNKDQNQIKSYIQKIIKLANIQIENLKEEIVKVS